MEDERVPAPKGLGERMIELPISAVVIEPPYDFRVLYPADEIAEACALLEGRSMIHPQMLARWNLIEGFLTYAALRALRAEVRVSRAVEAGGVHELANERAPVENLMGPERRARDLVEVVTRLRESGFGVNLIADYFQCSPRWVRRLCALKRDIHPELWAAFHAGSTKRLTLAWMLELAEHAPAEQLRRWRTMRGAS